MIQHLVLLRFTDALPAGQPARIVESLRAYAATLPGVRSYRCGTNVGVAGNYHFGIAATFDDTDAWKVFDEGAERCVIQFS